MKKITHLAAMTCLVVGFTPEILGFIGIAEIALASVSTQIGINTTWFSASSNLWVQMMTLTAAGDSRIIASFGFVFTGFALMILSDKMHEKQTIKRKCII